MSKDEIRQILNGLNTDEEIEKFVVERLTYLEDNSEEKILGQNYIDTFRDYISSKTHFKPVDRFNNMDCADLCYDDKTPYINLIKVLKATNSVNHDLLTLIRIYETVDNFLPYNSGNIDILGIRLDKYRWTDKVSIKDIKELKCGECSERAGLAQNLFKFLEMDSEFTGGYIDDVPHAYNLFYPNGYDNEPVVIFDSSQSLKFEDKTGHMKECPFYKVLKGDEYERFLSGEPLQLDLASTEKNHRTMYNDWLAGYELVSKNPTYTLGLDNKYTNNMNR